MKRRGPALTHRLSRVDFVLVGAPLLLLGAAATLRPSLVEPRCSAAVAPDSCEPETLPKIDQWGLRPIDRELEAWSDTTQNTAGVLAFSVPLIHAGLSAGSGGLFTAAAFAPVLAEWVLLAEASAWNAALNEWVRIGVQRPRPLLLTSDEKNREALRRQIGNYNSFYSGHTSFAFLAATLLATRWWSRRRPPAAARSRRAIFAAWTIATAAVTLAVATGILRVAAGRHYPTDVLFGALAGAALAWGLRQLHLRRP